MRLKLALSAHRPFIGRVAKLREPGRVVDDAVELVAMQHQVALAIGAWMNGVVAEPKRVRSAD